MSTESAQKREIVKLIKAYRMLLLESPCKKSSDTPPCTFDERAGVQPRFLHRAVYPVFSTRSRVSRVYFFPFVNALIQRDSRVNVERRNFLNANDTGRRIHGRT